MTALFISLVLVGFGSFTFFHTTNPLIEQISNSEERYRTLVKNVPGITYRCALDESWTMDFISDEVETLTGYPGSDFIGNKKRSFASIIHPDDEAMVTETVVRAVEEKKPYDIEYRIRASDGQVKWVFEKG